MMADINWRAVVWQQLKDIAVALFVGAMILYMAYWAIFGWTEMNP